MFLANFLIALREGVEAALIVGILVAYLKKVGRTDVLPRMWVGVVIAAVVPLAAGALMTWGPYTLTFQAQEILGGSLSLVAVAMITGMILWMGKNGKKMGADITGKADAALAGDSSGWGIVWLAVLSVGREGVETAVFVWATVKATTDGGFWQPSVGVLTGLIVAIFIGWLVYRGTARINLSVFFQITGLLLIFVAAGIVSYGIGDLQEASVLPGWGVPAYDITGYFDGSIPGLSPDTVWFVLLEAMFNLNLAPTYLQVIGWVVYLVIVLPIFIINIRGTRRAVKRAEHSGHSPEGGAPADGSGPAPATAAGVGNPGSDPAAAHASSRKEEQ